MSRFPGHIIKLPANTPSQSSAPGVWTLKDQLVAQRNNQWPFQRDPDFRYTTLLLQGNVPNTTGPQAMNLPLAYNSDASSNNFLITPNGDVSPRPFSPYGGGNYSGYFDGASDYVTLPSSADFSFGTADFTIEGWVHPTSWIGGSGVLQIGTTAFPSSVSNSVAFGLDGTPANSFQIYAKNAQHLSAGGYSPNTWHHFALVRSSSTTRLYINGRVAITVLSDTTNYTGTVLGFGAIYGTANFYTGYVSNVRVLKGTAAYTSDFTPAITPFPSSTTNQVLLAFASNRFIDSNTATTAKTLNVNGDVRVTDNSPFVSADFTTGSGYFDGTSDYLTGVANTVSAFNLTGDFTIECWAYFTSASTAGQGLVTWADSGGWNGWQLINDAGTIKFEFLAASSAAATATGGTVVNNQWYHIAVVRSGSAANNVTIYINGSSSGSPATYTGTQGTSASSYIRVGVDRTSNNEVVGYVSGVRVVKGAAVYSGNFTPPALGLLGTSGASSAAAYPSTTNVNTTFAESATSLLTLQTRAPSQNHGFIDSSPNEFIVTRNGNVSQGTFSPFSPTGWSNLFNGSNNGLTVPASSAFSFSGEFTWEAFVYFNAIPGSGASAFICSSRNTTASNSSFQFGIYNRPSVGTEVNITLSIGGTDYGIGWAITTPTIGVWYHVAVVRNASNTVSCYWDGSLKTLTQGSASAPGTTNTPTVPISVGYRGTPNNDLYLNGYISNLRMVASALYSGASITIPTAAFSPATANTRFLTCQSNRFAETAAGMAVTTINTPSVQAFSPFAPANSVSPLVTGGSGYFPSSATLTIPSAPALNLVGDFCMEGWAYPTATGFTFAWKYTGGNVGASEYWWVIDGTNQLSIALDGGGGEDYFRTAANTITLNAWNHCVLTRVGNEVRQFINGVLQSYNTTSRTLNATSTTFQTNGTLGYTSGFRIMKGSIPDAYRTTATTTGTTVFTPPTAPPVATQNTSLLLNFTGGGIVDATGKNVIETVGKVQIATAQAKWDFQRGGGSMQFDGGNGSLLIQNNYVPVLPTSGDLTIEMWVYPMSSSQQMLVSMAGGGASSDFNFYLQGSGAIGLETGDAWRDSSGSIITTNQWQHIALTKTGSTYRIFVGGIERTITGGGTMLTTLTTSPLYIGVSPTGTLRLNGYISNLRVSNLLRYTANFNANLPSGPFPIG